MATKQNTTREQEPSDGLPMTFDAIDWQGNKTLKGKPASPNAVPAEATEKE